MTARKTWLAAFATASVAAIALTGCAGGSDSGDENSLEMWHNSTTGAGKDYWDEVAAAFKEETGVTVTMTSVQNEDMDGKLQTASNSGDMPDIFMARGGGKLSDFVDAGVVKDITDLVSDDTKSGYGDAPFAPFTVDGAVYGMPVSVLPQGMFYSQDLFDEAGITETPKTIDDLNDAVAKLKDAGIEPIALGAKAAWPAAHWYYGFALRACSQDVLDSVASSLDFSDPCWLEAGQDLVDFAATEPFNKGFLTTDAQEGAGSSAGLIANHKAGMELMGGWDAGVIGDLTPDGKPLADLGWFPLPAVDGGAGDPAAMMGGVDGYSCSADSPSTCEDFLNFFARPEWQEKYATAFNAIPASKDAQGAVTDPSLQEMMGAYNDASYIVLWLDTLLGQNVGNALNAAVVETLAGSGTAESIVDAATQAAARG